MNSPSCSRQSHETNRSFGCTQAEPWNHIFRIENNEDCVESLIAQQSFRTKEKLDEENRPHPYLAFSPLLAINNQIQIREHYEVWNVFTVVTTNAHSAHRHSTHRAYTNTSTKEETNREIDEYIRCARRKNSMTLNCVYRNERKKTKKNDGCVSLDCVIAYNARWMCLCTPFAVWNQWAFNVRTWVAPKTVSCVLYHCHRGKKVKTLHMREAPELTEIQKLRPNINFSRFTSLIWIN